MEHPDVIEDAIASVHMIGFNLKLKFICMPHCHVSETFCRYEEESMAMTAITDESLRKKLENEQGTCGPKASGMPNFNMKKILPKDKNY